MLLRTVEYSEILNRWNVVLGFQPDWQQYENEYRHIEFGKRAFELRAPAKLNIGDVCLLEHRYESVAERVFTETVWVVDPTTGEPVRQERTLIAPVSDVDERELPTLGLRLLNGEGPILLDDGSYLRLREFHRYRLIRSDAQPDWKLVRVREGRYTPFYTNEPVPVSQNWPERYVKLTVLEAGTPQSEWRVTYALWPC